VDVRGSMSIRASPQLRIMAVLPLVVPPS